MPLIKINPRFPVTGRISFTPPCGDTSILRGCQAHLPPAAHSGAGSLYCPPSPGLPGMVPLSSGWLCVHPEVPGTLEIKFSSGGSGWFLQGSPSSTPRQTSQGISQMAIAGHRPFLQVTWGCLCRPKSLVRNPALCSGGHASVEPQLTVGSCGHSPGSDWLGELTQARRGYLITWGLRCQARFLLRVATWLLGYHPGLLMMAKPLQVMGDVELLGAVWLGAVGGIQNCWGTVAGLRMQHCWGLYMDEGCSTAGRDFSRLGVQHHWRCAKRLGPNITGGKYPRAQCP